MKELISFSTQSEMIVIKGRLESEGIDCMIKDELTVQINYLYAGPIGGIRLFVNPKDWDRANEILRENGFNIKPEKSSSPFMERLENVTARIPLIKKLPAPIVLISMVSIFIGILIGLVALQSQPNLSHELIGTSWCVDYVYHSDYPYEHRKPESSIESIYLNCNINIGFNVSNFSCSVLDKGYGSGNYFFEGDSLFISEVNYMKDTFEHHFKVRLVGNRLFLKSEKVNMRCVKQFSTFF